MKKQFLFKCKEDQIQENDTENDPIDPEEDPI